MISKQERATLEVLKRKLEFLGPISLIQKINIESEIKRLEALLTATDEPLAQDIAASLPASEPAAEVSAPEYDATPTSDIVSESIPDPVVTPPAHLRLVPRFQKRPPEASPSSPFQSVDAAFPQAEAATVGTDSTAAVEVPLETASVPLSAEVVIDTLTEMMVETQAAETSTEMIEPEVIEPTSTALLVVEEVVVNSTPSETQAPAMEVVDAVFEPIVEPVEVIEAVQTVEIPAELVDRVRNESTVIDPDVAIETILPEVGLSQDYAPEIEAAALRSIEAMLMAPVDSTLQRELEAELIPDALTPEELERIHAGLYEDLSAFLSGSFTSEPHPDMADLAEIELEIIAEAVESEVDPLLETLDLIPEYQEPDSYPLEEDTFANPPVFEEESIAAQVLGAPPEPLSRPINDPNLTNDIQLGLFVGQDLY